MESAEMSSVTYRSVPIEIPFIVRIESARMSSVTARSCPTRASLAILRSLPICKSPSIFALPCTLRLSSDTIVSCTNSVLVPMESEVMSSRSRLPVRSMLPPTVKSSSMFAARIFTESAEMSSAT